jgi:hypothetical protein
MQHVVRRRLCRPTLLECREVDGKCSSHTQGRLHCDMAIMFGDDSVCCRKAEAAAGLLRREVRIEYFRQRSGGISHP